MSDPSSAGVEWRRAIDAISARRSTDAISARRRLCRARRRDIGYRRGASRSRAWVYVYRKYATAAVFERIDAGSRVHERSRSRRARGRACIDYGCTCIVNTRPRPYSNASMRYLRDRGEIAVASRARSCIHRHRFVRSRRGDRVGRDGRDVRAAAGETELRLRCARRDATGRDGTRDDATTTRGRSRVEGARSRAGSRRRASDGARDARGTRATATARSGSGETDGCGDRAREQRCACRRR